MIDRNKDSNSTKSTFSILFANYKIYEVVISHVPFCYEKTYLPSLTSTQLLFFEKINIKQVSGSCTTSQNNEYNVSFTRYEEGKVYVEIGVYDTINQPKR